LDPFAQLFGADASSLLIVQEAMRYAATTGKEDEAEHGNKPAGQKSGGPVVDPDRVNALVAAAEQHQAAAGLAAVSGSVSGAISPSSLGAAERGNGQGAMLGGPHHHHHATQVRSCSTCVA
jgi:hypothetical protein